MSCRTRTEPNHVRRGTALLAIVGTVAIAAGAAPADRRAGRVEFNRDIRPILSDNCFLCHGPDKKNRKADLRLDDRESALALAAIVAGKPDESELIARIQSDDPEEMMPPPRSRKKLTAAQKELLGRWIAEGAEYQPHWAYVPPRRGEPPAVARRGWVRNPIDNFILATLESKAIEPSPEADRRTLLRRLALDLTGLPPTSEEVEAFVADTDPNAYERQVDRLLRSPHYGERMAVPWLDLVRYADTVGYHGDQNQNVFPYRDYVINAFNKNMPFDRFTVEQLAGDLLPNPTTEQLVATCFNRLNMMTREGGAQAKEYLAKYAADRVRTVSTTWLGSTMGCAECHDHKYDPFKSRDFYSLGAFFADVKQWGIYSSYAYTPNPELKGWSNDHPFPPEIEVESPNLLRRLERLKGEIHSLVAGSSAKLAGPGAPGAAFRAWCRQARAFLEEHPGGWAYPRVELADASARGDVTLLDGGEVLFNSDKPSRPQPRAKAKARARRASHTFALKAEPGWLAAIRVEAVPRPEHGGTVVRGGGESALVQVSAAWKPARGGKTRPLGFAWADADLKDPRYSNSLPVLGVKGGWKTSSQHRQSRQASVWLLDRPIQAAEGDQVLVTVTSNDVGCVRIGLSPLAVEDPRRPFPAEALAGALGSAPGERSAEQKAALNQAYLLGTSWDPAAFTRFQELRSQVLACRDGRAFVQVTQACDPLTMRVLPRGNWLDESGEIVVPAVPAFLPQPPNPEGRRLTRLDLARWLTAPENPLTARVFVNRLWKQFFGTGLSAVMEDVGAQGEPPVHPELLDWLAVEFRESGWNVKHAVKLLVMSATYRQDSRVRPELQEVDPNNRLLAAQSPRRLDAEFVRDNALAIAGLIDLELGGPSAFPYQPDGYYDNIQFPNRRYVADRDERQYRRGVYAHWQRTFLQPMLANFDAPSREECTASRTVANTPQQALTLLNDPTFVEAARVLAERLLTSPARSDGERIDRLYRRALSRPPKAREAESLERFLAAQRAQYRGQTDDANKLVQTGIDPVPAHLDRAELAAWTSVCRVVLNLHETITRY
jgi:hypothetical protein